ncbi:hypothetical protein IAU59_007498 [Kwoniella sp. CBS 9459]
MATVYPEGPLDEYFRGENGDDSLMTATLDDSLHRSLHEDTVNTMTSLEYELRRHSNESGDTTLVSAQWPFEGRIEDKGWTGVRPNVPGPSSSPTRQRSLDHPYPYQDPARNRLGQMVPGKFPSPTRLSFDQETFAEKFKYMICSSGLLEKDYVPALSGGLDASAEGMNEAQEHQANDMSSSSANTIRLDLSGEVQKWAGLAKERWDLALAGLCLLVGLGLSLGVWTLAALVVLLSSGGVWYIGRITATKKCKLENVQAKPVSPLATSHRPETAQSRALASLTTFISQSHSLNSTLSSSLALLDPHPYALGTHHTLRVTLHRLTGNMTDHLATATSTLLELTDRRELGVLGEMYDIPVVGSFFYSRRHRHPLSSSSSEEEEEEDEEEEREGLSDSQGITRTLPGRTSAPADRSPFDPTSYSRRSSRASVPLSATQTNSSSPLKRLHTHSHRTQHLSLMSQRDAEDKFTQLPDKTPRLSRRSSADRLQQSSSSARSLRVERPRHERRITEADEGMEDAEDDGDGDISRSDRSGSSEGDGKTDDIYPVKRGVIPSPTSPILQESARIVPRTPILTQGTPRGSPSPFRHVPSPLSRRLSTASGGLQPLHTAALVTPSRSTGRSPSLLASPFLSGRESSVPPSSAPLRAALSLDAAPSPGGNPKRRSLQNMPYYHSSDDDHNHSISEGLTRTRSMPLSDLQALRTASSTGSRTRRSSLNPAYGLGISPNLLPQLSPAATTTATGVVGTGLGYGLPPASSSFPPDKRASVSTIFSQHSYGHSPRPSLALKRVESVSPLTAPALKAGCLGIHLKRRRLACCLLGLRFGESDEYWEEVRTVLSVLIEGITEERSALDAVLRGAQKEAEATATLDSLQPNIFGALSDAWSPAESVFPPNIHGPTRRTDFAPRTSDEAPLLGHIDTMGSALVKAWMDLSSFREALRNGDLAVQCGSGGWGEVRGKLGEAIREWERGREVLSRMKEDHSGRGSNSAQDTRAEAQDNEGSIPAFMRAWDDPDLDGGEGDTSQSTSLVTDRDNENENDHDENNGDPRRALTMLNEPEHLPPVGKDTVFEGTSLPPLSSEKETLGKMTRDERIKLAREAREMGLSLGDLLLLKRRDAGPTGDGVEERSVARTEKEMRTKGGLVVDELRGVIGAIRRMKEGKGDGDGDIRAPSASKDEEARPVATHVMIDRSLPENDRAVQGDLRAGSDSASRGLSLARSCGGQNDTSAPDTAIDNQVFRRDSRHGVFSEDGDGGGHEPDSSSSESASTDTDAHEDFRAESEIRIGNGHGIGNVDRQASLAPPVPFDIGELKRSFQFPRTTMTGGIGSTGGEDEHVLE